MTMNNDQVGMYIRLMCLQHQKGRLTEKDMLNICKSYDEDVFQKFTKDENGFYSNGRLSHEIQRRIDYSNSRRKNRTSNNISKSYDQHMENETENENVIDTVPIKNSEKFRKPEIENVVSMFLDLGMNEINANKQSILFVDHYTSNGWKVGRNTMKDWKAAARGWANRMNNFKNKGNATNTGSFTPGRKQAGAHALLEELRIEATTRRAANG